MNKSFELSTDIQLFNKNVHICAVNVIHNFHKKKKKTKNQNLLTKYLLSLNLAFNVRITASSVNGPGKCIKSSISIDDCFGNIFDDILLLKPPPLLLVLLLQCIDDDIELFVLLLWLCCAKILFPFVLLFPLWLLLLLLLQLLADESEFDWNIFDFEFETDCCWLLILLLLLWILLLLLLLLLFCWWWFCVMPHDDRRGSVPPHWGSSV